MRTEGETALKTFLLVTIAGCILGTIGGYAFAAFTENLPHYRTQAAFTDGLYKPILAFPGALLGALAGFTFGLLALFVRRNK